MGEGIYIFLGCAEGRFEREDKEKQDYFNMYVASPVSSYVSDDYRAMGYKAEKFKCVSAKVWEGLEPGEKVQLFFDSKNRVALATSEGPGIKLPD